MSSHPVDVLVVGAGPVGMALGLQAIDHGARIRLIDRRTEPFRPSRALIVHPRTLEVLRPLGVTDDLLAGGDVAPLVRLHVGTRDVPVRLGPFDLPDTPFPHLLFVRQAVVEAVLADALAARGVKIEWATELVGLREPANEAVATVARPGTAEEIAASFVAGCDGANSTVRRLCGTGWRGRPYRQEAVLADVELDGGLATEAAHVVAGRQGLLFLFPLGEQATWRLLATRAVGDVAASERAPPVAAGELQSLIDQAGLRMQIHDVAWSAQVGLQHRMATRYRKGRRFLVGDAAHTHSPAGGLGMNTGIQDALNLGWKLALAARGEPSALDAPLLASYEAERRPVARRVLALTDTLFWAEAGTDAVAAFVRGNLGPIAAPLVPHVLARRRLVAHGVRTLSQLAVHYRGSPLSVDAVPCARRSLRPGDRLPDQTVMTRDGRRRLHELMARPGVQVLLARHAPQPDEAALGPLVRVDRVVDWPGTNALAVRPDGYVGFRGASADSGQLLDWLAVVGALAAPTCDMRQMSGR